MRTARPRNTSSLRVAALAGLMLAVASAGAAGDPGLRVQEMYVRSIAKAPPKGGRQRFDFLVFYANGAAYRGDASFFTNESLSKDRLGTYQAVGDDIRISWPAGKTEVMRRRGERLSSAAGTRWQRLPKVSGLRLQGTYAIAARTADLRGAVRRLGPVRRDQHAVAREPRPGDRAHGVLPQPAPPAAFRGARAGAARRSGVEERASRPAAHR